MDEPIFLCIASFGDWCSFFFFCFFLHPVAWEVAPLNLKDPLCAGIGWERGPWINPVRMRNELLERRNLFARF